jgi:multiple sugar transport system ATP-binding protein
MRRITLENVSKTYPSGVVALDDVSLSVEPGAWLVLVGPSGCGKTTLLRVIAGLETPTHGMVRLGVRDVTAVPPHQREVALLFQRPALVPGRTVYDNLAWPWLLRRRGPWSLLRRLLGRPALSAAQEGELRRVAELLGITDLLARRAEELSGGQQQRVALGRALLRRADVVLLDEPLEHLEAPLRGQLRRELRLLSQQFPATIIYVTHDPAEALALGERVAVLENGRLRQVGAPGAVEQTPANRFVAEFFSPNGPTNFLDGEVVKDGNSGSFVGAWGRWELPAAIHQRLPAGRELTVGVRAEDVKVVTAEFFNAQSDIILHGRILLLERAQDGDWITCQLTGIRMTGQAVAGNGFEMGQQAMLTFALRDAYWFDRLTGTTLLVRTG